MLVLIIKLSNSGWDQTVTRSRKGLTFYSGYASGPNYIWLIFNSDTGSLDQELNPGSLVYSQKALAV